jgi:hypothetical protein
LVKTADSRAKGRKSNNGDAEKRQLAPGQALHSVPPRKSTEERADRTGVSQHECGIAPEAAVEPLPQPVRFDGSNACA